LATFRGSCSGVFAGRAGGVDRSAKRRHAHCKFIVVAPAHQSFSKIRVSLEINARPQNDALILKSHTV
jgi:hypothetical protein